MSNRTDPLEDIQTEHVEPPEDQSSPVRPALVGSGMFLPGIIVFVIALAVIPYFVFR